MERFENMVYIAEFFGKEEEVQAKIEAYEKEANGLIVLANDKVISVFG